MLDVHPMVEPHGGIKRSKQFLVGGLERGLVGLESENGVPMLAGGNGQKMFEAFRHSMILAMDFPF